jgi:hypothetical protein
MGNNPLAIKWKEPRDVHILSTAIGMQWLGTGDPGMEAAAVINYIDAELVSTGLSTYTLTIRATLYRSLTHTVSSVYYSLH